MKRILKILLIIVGIILMLIIGVVILFSFASKQPVVKEDYFETVTTNMPLEQNYTVMGQYEVSAVVFESNSKKIGQFKVWYPTEMERTSNTYPLVVMANGTGVKASKYEAIFMHLASWGFIVIGNEGKGMSRLVSENCDFIASISMKGKVNSLNASVAAALIIFEAMGK